MSSTSQKAVATIRRPKFEPSKPDFVLRAEDPQKPGNWLNLGGAWRGEDRDGNEMFTLRMSTIPLGTWDGKLKMLIARLPKNGEIAPETEVDDERHQS